MQVCGIDLSSDGRHDQYTSPAGVAGSWSDDEHAVETKRAGSMWGHLAKRKVIAPGFGLEFCAF